MVAEKVADAGSGAFSFVKNEILQKPGRAVFLGLSMAVFAPAAAAAVTAPAGAGLTTFATTAGAKVAGGVQAAPGVIEAVYNGVSNVPWGETFEAAANAATSAPVEQAAAPVTQAAAVTPAATTPAVTTPLVETAASATSSSVVAPVTEVTSTAASASATPLPPKVPAIDLKYIL